MPKSSTPALLLMTVRSFVPRACSAWIRFSGMPHRPKPPIRIVAPSGSARPPPPRSGRTLFMRRIIPSSYRSALRQRAGVARRPRRADRRSSRSPRSSCSTAISVSSAAPISSALVAAMSLQISAGLEASRVVSTSPRPASASPSSPTASPTTCISALAVSCGRWLRNASSRSCAVDADDARHRAERARERQQLLERLARRVVRRREQPRTALEQIRPRVLEAARRGAAERMAADEREPRRQRVAPPRRSPASCCRCRSRPPACGRSRRARRAARRFCRTGAARMTRSASASTIRSSAATSIACSRIAVSRTSLLSTAMTSDGRPDLPRRQRDRSADQPEADDADLLRRSGCPAPADRLNDGNSELRSIVEVCPSSSRSLPSRAVATGSRQMLRPIAGAMMRSSAISRSNCAGNIDCAPSLSA